jgi:GMP synthase (glutamine-hydrolysing)
MTVVLVLQHAAVEGPGRLGRALEAVGVSVRLVRAGLGEPVPAGLEGAAGLVALGGPMSVSQSERYPHLRAERALLERALVEGAPVLGICLGSQLLAAALGARVYAGERPEIGWGEVALRPAAADDPLFRGAPSRFAALHWHGDVFDLPAGARALAHSSQTTHQAFGHESGVYGLLFHLEVDGAQARAMAEASSGELREAGVDPARLARAVADGEPEAEPVARTIFGAWASMARARGA